MRNIVARAVDSAIVAARAPWSARCSVVTNVTAEGRGSLLVAANLLRWTAGPTASQPLATSFENRDRPREPPFGRGHTDEVDARSQALTSRGTAVDPHVLHARPEHALVQDRPDQAPRDV